MGSPSSGQNIRQDGLSQSVSRSIGAIQLCDRFQGAVLGVSLLPTALSPTRSAALSRYAESPWARSPLQQALDCSLAQIQSFVSAPNTWTVDLSCLPNPAFLLPAGVPVLLRYHHSWKRRCDRLLRLQLQIDRLPVKEGWGKAIAQLLMLGDLLEVMSLDASQLSSQTDWIAWLTDCATRYRLAPQIHVRYEELLEELLSSLNTRTDGLTGDETQKSFLTGVTSALAHLESYVLAVQGLSGYSSIRTAKLGSAAQTGAKATEAVPLWRGSANASDWLTAFVVGLLSGAFSGSRGLPALWQMCPDLDRHRALANELFSLWAGELSAVSLPD